MPETGYLLAVIAIGFGITFALRALPFVILQPLRDSRLVTAMALWMPAGILAILAVSTLRSSIDADTSRLLPAAIATGVTIAAHLLGGRRTLLSVGLGTVTFVALVNLLRHAGAGRDPRTATGPRASGWRGSCRERDAGDRPRLRAAGGPDRHPGAVRGAQRGRARGPPRRVDSGCHRAPVGWSRPSRRFPTACCAPPTPLLTLEDDRGGLPDRPDHRDGPRRDRLHRGPDRDRGPGAARHRHHRPRRPGVGDRDRRLGGLGGLRDRAGAGGDRHDHQLRAHRP